MVLTIIQTLFNKRIFGMRFLKAVNLKKKYSNLIFSSIILIFIMYFFVVKDMLAGVLFVFFCSVILIIYLIFNTLKLIINPEKLEKDIIKHFEEKILYISESKNEVKGENENKEIIEQIKQLRAHTIDLITQDNDTEATENINLIFNLISLDNNIKITDQLNSTMIDIINKFQSVRRFEQANEIIVQYYYIVESSDDEQTKIKNHNKILKIVEYRLLILKALDNSQEVYEHADIELLILFSKNLDKSKDSFIIKYLSEAFQKLFTSIINSKLSKIGIVDVLEIYYNKLFTTIFGLYKSINKIEHFVYLLANISDNFFRLYTKSKESVYLQNYWKIYDYFNNYPTTLSDYKWINELCMIYVIRVWCNNPEKVTMKLYKNAKKDLLNWGTSYQVKVNEFWDSFDFSKRVMRSLESNYHTFIEEPYSPSFDYKTLHFYIFTTIIHFYDYNDLLIMLNVEDYRSFNNWYEKGKFRIESKGTKEYIEKFYNFTGFTPLVEKDFVYRANKFYKHVGMKNEEI
ncbi:MAG: hypothetical protein P9M11_01600 [Candidatus Tenebribacter burtonii]|nr:hypothetical protein [Candidatus Tenebribacter burtonii]